MTKAPDPQPDDLEAVRAVVGALEKFKREDQQRILRWAQEKLGMAGGSAYAPPPTRDATGTAGALPPATTQSLPPAATDIKTFIARKKPSSDNQLTAAIAYYYRFEAPQELRKESLKAQDLADAARALGQGGRFVRPAQTLVNAHQQGLLDRSAEGKYTLSNVGENLVAVTLGAEGGDGSQPAAPRKKPRARRGAKSAKKKNAKKPRR